MCRLCEQKLRTEVPALKTAGLMQFTDQDMGDGNIWQFSIHGKEENFVKTERPHSQGHEPGAGANRMRQQCSGVVQAAQACHGPLAAKPRTGKCRRHARYRALILLRAMPACKAALNIRAPRHNFPGGIMPHAPGVNPAMGAVQSPVVSDGLLPARQTPAISGSHQNLVGCGVWQNGRHEGGGVPSSTPAEPRVLALAATRRQEAGSCMEQH